MERTFGKSILEIVQGDITKLPADAIANAANSRLAGGGGVDGAIHRAGGSAIMAELDVIRSRRRGCAPGSAVATTAGKLPAKWVFHAVGPVYESGEKGERDLLGSAYRACLALAEEKHVRTLSFPSISTGVYGYPVREASAIALSTVKAHLEGATCLQKVLFVLFDAGTLAAYEDALRSL
ncbi:MAG: O-acetyl-ADP-ribose deacetylase [Planctomycetes bacterium]|nr:O-acetyl-ADP-ribose deacetylase [Planctomycetota bacterium]